MRTSQREPIELKRPVRALSPVGANVGDGDGGGEFDWSPDSSKLALLVRKQKRRG